MRFGRFEVSTVNFGFFRLDGGAMFGSVPKNIWSKLIPVDEENCIPLATRCLLVEGDGRRILVDVGIGDKFPAKQKSIFGIRNFSFDELGFDPSTVTDLVLTHLHFDHAGGISYLREDGVLSLTYPSARVWIQGSNYENARTPHLRERASYLSENVSILEQADLRLLDGATEIFPDFWVFPVHGHTKGQQFIELRDGDARVVYPTDLIPTSRHLPIPYHMGYDMCAETVLAERESLLKEVVSRDALIVFEHDPDIPACRVGVNDKGHYTVREVIKI